MKQLIKKRGFDVWSASSTSVSAKREAALSFGTLSSGQVAGKDDRQVRDVVSPWQQGALVFFAAASALFSPFCRIEAFPFQPPALLSYIQTACYSTAKTTRRYCNTAERQS